MCVCLVDSQGSADTSRSQHTDITSELSSVVSVPDKTGILLHDMLTGSVKINHVSSKLISIFIAQDC